MLADHRSFLVFVVILKLDLSCTRVAFLYSMITAYLQDFLCILLSTAKGLISQENWIGLRLLVGVNVVQVLM